MATLTIQFDMDNTAFDDRPEEEISHILSNIAANISMAGLDFDYKPVRDSNGNKIGFIMVEGV